MDTADQAVESCQLDWSEDLAAVPDNDGWVVETGYDYGFLDLGEDSANGLSLLNGHEDLPTHTVDLLSTRRQVVRSHAEGVQIRGQDRTAPVRMPF